METFYSKIIPQLLWNVETKPVDKLREKIHSTNPVENC